MLIGYFEPQALDKLTDILGEARKILEDRGEASPQRLEYVAQSIVFLASNGLPPQRVLRELSDRR